MAALLRPFQQPSGGPSFAPNLSQDQPLKFHPRRDGLVPWEAGLEAPHKKKDRRLDGESSMELHYSTGTQSTVTVGR